MTVLARLNFSCTSREAADVVLAEHSAQLEQVRAGSVPEVTVGTCCGGSKVIRLDPYWYRRSVTRVDPSRLRMVATFRPRRGVVELLIEVSAFEGES